MAKLILKCPNCEQDFHYKFLGKEAASTTCKKCGKKLSISMRYSIWILELLLFYVYINQVQPSFMPEASIPTILIGMLGFCGGITFAICAVLNHFIGTGFLFEVRVTK